MVYTCLVPSPYLVPINPVSQGSHSYLLRTPGSNAQLSFPGMWAAKWQSLAFDQLDLTSTPIWRVSDMCKRSTAAPPPQLSLSLGQSAELAPWSSSWRVVKCYVKVAFVSLPHLPYFIWSGSRFIISHPHKKTTGEYSTIIFFESKKDHVHITS